MMALGSTHPLGPDEVGVEALAVVRALEAPVVEVRLAERARSGAPLRRVLAALAGRLVATRAWDRLGYVRLRDYAREQLGLSLRPRPGLRHRGCAGLPPPPRRRDG